MIAAGISTASVARLPDITDCNYIVIHMSSIQQQVRTIIINPHNINRNTGTGHLIESPRNVVRQRKCGDEISEIPRIYILTEVNI